MKNIFLIILLCLPLYTYAGVKLTDVTISNSPNSARVQFKTSDSIQPKIFTLAHPDRLVVDFNNIVLAANLHKLSAANGPFDNVRVGHPAPTVLRFVFDTKQAIKYKTQVENNEIFLDVYLQPSEKENTTTRNVPVLVANRAPKPMIVVIDPGHGGKDPGAQGEQGAREKHIVLGVATKLANLINRQPHMRAVLTRDNDYFVPLAGRLKLARKGKADLFVAIHADSYFNDRANGASVYALSARGATSVAARWLANRENHSELGGVDLRELEDQSVQLRSVLIDLAQTATIIDSLHLGNSILKSLDAVTNLHYNRVEQAPFMVLKSPDIPSVLVELGFLSNPREEMKLRDPKYQNKLAQALFNGIQIYFKKYTAIHL